MQNAYRKDMVLVVSGDEGMSDQKFTLCRFCRCIVPIEKIACDNCRKKYEVVK